MLIGSLVLHILSPLLDTTVEFRPIDLIVSAKFLLRGLGHFAHTLHFLLGNTLTYEALYHKASSLTLMYPVDVHTDRSQRRSDT